VKPFLWTWHHSIYGTEDGWVTVPEVNLRAYTQATDQALRYGIERI
jgi:hypothetical protein